MPCSSCLLSLRGGKAPEAIFDLPAGQAGIASALLGCCLAMTCSLLFFIFILSRPAAAEAASPALQCDRVTQQQAVLIREQVRILEKAYTQYRWTQRKLRRLVYQDLWAARNLQNYPFGKEERKTGVAEEQELLDVAARYEEESAQASNGIELTLNQLEAWNEKWKTGCSEPAFASCVDGLHKNFVVWVREIRERFSHIYEREREQMTAVRQTSARKEGLYLEDSLEAANAHWDQYERFERDREPDNHEEDVWIMDRLLKMYRFLDAEGNMKACCPHCWVKNEK